MTAEKAQPSTEPCSLFNKRCQSTPKILTDVASAETCSERSKFSRTNSTRTLGSRIVLCKEVQDDNPSTAKRANNKIDFFIGLFLPKVLK